MPTVNAPSGSNLQALVDGCANPSSSNRYEIVLVSGGVYDLLPYITTGPNGVYAGVNTRDYVDLVSYETNPALQPHVYIHRPDGSTNCGNYEVIALRKYCKIKNIKITCKNARYPVHLDETAARISSIEGGRLEHFGCWIADGSRYASQAESGWISYHGLGGSIWGGSNFTLNNVVCVARGIASASAYVHNNSAQAAGATFNIIGGSLLHPDGGPSIQTDAVGSTKVDILNISGGCVLEGPIVYSADPAAPVSDQNEWRITSDGTNTIPALKYAIRAGSNLNYRPALAELTNQLTNVSATAITRGQLLATTTGGVRAFTSSDTFANFAGVAYANIGVNATGAVFKPNKTIFAEDIGLSSVALNALIGAHPTVAGSASVGGSPTVGTVTSIWSWWNQYTTLLNSWGVIAAPENAQLVTLNGGVGSTTAPPTTTTTTTPAPVVQYGTGTVRIKTSTGVLLTFNPISNGSLRLSSSIALALGGNGPVRVLTPGGPRSIR